MMGLVTAVKRFDGMAERARAILIKGTTNMRKLALALAYATGGTSVTNMVRAFGGKV